MLRMTLAHFEYDIEPGPLLPMVKSPQDLCFHDSVSDQTDT